MRKTNLSAAALAAVLVLFAGLSFWHGAGNAEEYEERAQSENSAEEPGKDAESREGPEKDGESSYAEGPEGDAELSYAEGPEGDAELSYAEGPEGDAESEHPDYEVENIGMSREEEKEAAKKLLSVIGRCGDIYRRADKGEGSNVVLEDAAVHQMIDRAASEGDAVTCGDHDYNMQNYEAVHEELLRAEKGGMAETEFYAVNGGGRFSYQRLEFADGALTVTYASAGFDDDMEAVVSYMEKVRVYRWEYTEKGWLIWEKARSRNQEMDMHLLYRILPLEERCREIARTCIAPVSYFCNNLFLTDWDKESQDRIVFNDLFDFLYSMTAKKRLDAAEYADGIPQEEFEEIVQTYFDISAEEIRKYADFDAEKGVYPWEAIGRWNHVRQLQPFPEVVRCEENEDGTLSVYVDAVLTERGADRAFGHVVTIREKAGGGWVYCGNRVDREHAQCIPGYRARREYPY